MQQQQQEMDRDGRLRVSARPSLSEALSADDPLAQWKAFYSLLVSAVPGLQSDEQYAFQFTNPERGADWYKENRGSDVVTLVDAKPASSGAFYGPGVSTVSDNYDMLLNAIKGEDPSLEKARKRFDKALEEDKLAMSLDGDLAADLESWKKGEGNPLDITITRSTKIDHQWRIAAGGEAGYSGFLVSRRGESLDAKAVDETYRLNVRYAGITAYPVVRDRSLWNGGLLRAYGTDATEFLPPYTRRTFFCEEGGMLNAVPASVVVAYGARLSLRLSRTFYQAHKFDLEGEGQISLGPFKLNGTVRYVRTEEQRSEDAAVLEYESTRRVPVVFGVFSETFLMD